MSDPHTACPRARRVAWRTSPNLDGICSLEVHDWVTGAKVASYSDATVNAISRDGTRLAFVRSDGNLEIVRLP